MDDNKAMCCVGYVNKASVKLRIFVFVTLKTDFNWHTVILYIDDSNLVSDQHPERFQN